jgi:hypothetical protein
VQDLANDAQVAGSKYCMRFTEISSTPPKPPTPEQLRVKSLQQKVETDRQQLQAERDKQRKQRDAERLRKLQQPKPQ